MIVYSAGTGGGTGAGGSCFAPRLLMDLVRAVLHKAADAAECEAAGAAECEAACAAECEAANAAEGKAACAAECEAACLPHSM